MKKVHVVLYAFIGCILLAQLYIYGKSYVFKMRAKAVAPTYKKSVDFKCADLGMAAPSELVPNIKFLLYIISHDDASYQVALKWSRCKPWTRVVRISSTVYFESIIYKEYLPAHAAEWEALDFVGIATYRSLKFASLEKIKSYLELAYYKPYDVMPLYASGEYLVDQAVQGHTERFIHVWDALLQNMGFTVQEIRKHDHVEVFLRNSLIIRPRQLRGLITFMTTAMNAVVNNSTLRDLFATNANYRESVYRKSVAQRIFHTDYYQWHPFIFERLPAFYLSVQNASVYSTLRETEWFDIADSLSIFKGL